MANEPQRTSEGRLGERKENQERFGAGGNSCVAYASLNTRTFNISYLNRVYTQTQSMSMGPVRDSNSSLPNLFLR